MARQTRQSNVWDFGVEQVPAGEILTSTGTRCKPRGFFNVRTDTGEAIGYTADKYGLIQNRDVVGAAEEAFDSLKSELGEFSRSMIVTGNGEKLYATYDFKDRTKALKVGDDVGMRLTVQNSFDKTLRLSFAVGALRLICTNGMTTMEKDVSMTSKHSLNISTAFITKAVDTALKRFNSACGVFDKMATIKVDQLQGINMLNRLEKAKVISGTVRKGIAGIWSSPNFKADADRTLWNLYNAGTEYLTHNVQGERFEYAHKTSAGLLSNFNRMATKGLGEWINPLPAEAVLSSN